MRNLYHNFSYQLWRREEVKSVTIEAIGDAANNYNHQGIIKFLCAVNN